MITPITSLIRKVSYDSSPDTHQKYTRITMSIGVQHSRQLMPVLLWSVSRTASLLYTVWVGWTQLDLYSCIFQTHSFLCPSFSGRAFSASPAWSTPQCCRCPCWLVRQCTIVSKVGECRLLARTANTVAAVDSAAGGAKYDRSGVGAVQAAAVKKLVVVASSFHRLSATTTTTNSPLALSPATTSHRIYKPPHRHTIPPWWLTFTSAASPTWNISTRASRGRIKTQMGLMLKLRPYGAIQMCLLLLLLLLLLAASRRLS